MPAVTAASVILEAQKVYLNDASGVLFTDAILAPFLKSSYEDFRNECALNGVSQGLVKVAPAVIPIGTTNLGTLLPADLLVPIELGERDPGSTDPYIPMQETMWEPDIKQTTMLNFWSWRNSDIYFVGALSVRQIQIKYYWDFSVDSVDESSTDLVANGRAFLSAKLAAKVQQFVNQNDALAAACNGVAEQQLTKIIGIMVRNRQGVPTRQVGFGSRRGIVGNW